MKNLHSLSCEIYEANKAKGFHDVTREKETYLGLIISELAEALEADRKGFYVSKDITPIKTFLDSHFDGELWPDKSEWYETFEECYKDRIEDEIGDTYIRILDFLGSRGEAFQLESYQPSPFKFETKEIPSKIYEIMKSVVCCKPSYLVLDGLQTLADELKIDLESHIKAKLLYNQSRTIRHGKKAY